MLNQENYTADVAANIRRGSWMQTYTGRKFWPLDPREEEIQIEDIAHSLSMQCRYAGHCLDFYSVAEHSCHIADYFIEDGETELAKWALLHDAPEAYLVDVPRPVKPHLPGYKELDVALMACIARRYNLAGAEKVTLSRPLPERIAVADTRILNNERAAVMSPTRDVWSHTDLRPLPRVAIKCLSPMKAKGEFLARFNDLFGRQAA